MRNKAVTIASKTVDVQERRIGELKQLSPTCSRVRRQSGQHRISKILETNVTLLSKKLPKSVPGLTEEDIDNAYERVGSLFEAFVDVIFSDQEASVTLMNLAQAGAISSTSAPQATPTSRRAGTMRKR